MSLLAQPAGQSTEQTVSRQARYDHQQQVADFQLLLESSVQQGEGIDRRLLRLWLISTACRLQNVESSRVWRRAAAYFPGSSRCEQPHKAFCLQLLQLASEAEPPRVDSRTSTSCTWTFKLVRDRSARQVGALLQVGQLLARFPRIVRHLFTDHPEHIVTWFQSSYVGNISEFKRGARALAQYALLHRAEMWDLLVWQGKHPQAPVAVAAKPHYFSELNIKQTVRNLLKHHPQFFASEQMTDSVRSGDILTLDPSFFSQELYEVLAEGEEDIEMVVKTALARQPFQQICQRLLHCLEPDALPDFLCGIMGRSSSVQQLKRAVLDADRPAVGSAAAAVRQLEQCLLLMIFGCIGAQSLDSMATYVACAFHFQHVQRSWEQSGLFQEILRQAKPLCSHESLSVLCSMSGQGPSESQGAVFQHALLAFVSVKCTLAQFRSCSHKGQQALLKSMGITGSFTVSASHELLRPPKKRKEHKHRRQKIEKKRRRTEGMMPLSSDEDASDSELGIMPADSSDGEPHRREPVTWTLQFDKQTYDNISEQDVSEVVLWTLLVNWLSHLFA